MKLRLESMQWNELQTIYEKLQNDNKYLNPYSEYEFLNKIRKTT